MLEIFTTNTCYITTIASRNIAYYSHLIPIFFSLFLAFLVFIKSRKNTLSKIFLAFSTVFSIWLIGDLITWTSNNYHLIYASWSLLVYIEILFYILGLYFVISFYRKSDISVYFKVILFLATILPYLVTILLKSVDGFYYPVCEALNNSFLDQYKLYLEILILLVILFYLLLPLFRKRFYKYGTYSLVVGSIFLFLLVFGITEYLAATTGFYEINLYALFVIPVFLMAITYSIFRLDIFNLKLVSTYFIVFGFLVLTAIQLLFMTSSTDKLLTILTIALSLFLAFILFKNLKRESSQRIQIEKLNADLQKLIQQRESLVHLITHKVKGSFTRSKYIFSEMLEGSFGQISPELKKMGEAGMASDDIGIRTVDLILNASNLQKGTVKFEMRPVDLKKLVLDTFENRKELAQNKGLEIKTEIEDDIYIINGDIFWLKEVVENLIDNALKYTPRGEITVGLTKKDKKITYFVKDTGIGITAEDKKNLFTEGGRGKDSVKINVDSTGYGLYSVKLIVDAHKGRVWEKSDGLGKGSQFFAEFDAA